MSPLEEMLLRRRQSARRHTDGLGPLMVPCLVDGREVLGECLPPGPAPSHVILHPDGRVEPVTPKRGSIVDIDA
ncbi:MAG TPA: hypothetical protein PKN52_00110 [Trueperaceae bacterium]|nr:hypothetical protein [Trueperaceae bacterium]